jgi:PAS domain S-box-containing protein
MLDHYFRAVLDNAADGVLVEAGDRIAYANVAYARLLHYPNVEELVAATVRHIAHPEDVDRLRWYGALRSAGKPAPVRYTFRAVGHDGNVVTLDASVSHARVAGDVLITTIVRELTDAEPDTTDVMIPGIERLSSRELEIIRLLLGGRRSKEIAYLLDVSENTVYTHRTRAFQKLGIRGDRDLFRLAAEARLSEAQRRLAV